MKSEENQKEKPKIRDNLVLNLLDREIASQQRKYASQQNTYRHPYQLVASLEPKSVHDFDLDDCEPPTDNAVKFSTLADCLGFSPDGKYLAFHSHARTAISVLQYSGVEGGKVSGRKPNVTDFFGTKRKLDLGESFAVWNYDNDSAYGSWWTDDSSTLIVLIRVKRRTREDWIRLLDADELDRVNVAMSDERAQWRAAGEDNDQPPEEAEPVVVERAEQFQPPVVPQQRPEEPRSAQAFDQYINVVTVDGNVKLESEVVNEERTRQNGETSRTIPYWVAMESASEMNRDAKDGETSRTMTVYHALTSSVANGSKVEKKKDSDEESEEEEEEEEAAPQEPEAKRIKIVPEEPKTVVPAPVPVPQPIVPLSLAEKMRLAMLKKKEEKELGVNGERRSDEPCGFSKCLQKWIEKSKGSPYMAEKDGTNPSGLGYSNPSSFIRRAQRSGANRQPRGSYAERIDAAIEEQRGLGPPIRILPDIEEPNQDTESGICFMFIAYNVKTGQDSPLPLLDVFRNFEWHVRDRTVTVAFNNDYVHTYHLNTDHEWHKGLGFRLTSLNQTICTRYYNPGTVPGMASASRNVHSQEVYNNVISIGRLYNYYEFYSPVQQATKALIYRDMPNWFSESEVFRTEKPTLTRCHMIEDNVLALTVTFQSHPSKKPINFGVIVNLVDQSFKLYPDYLKFLQLLLTHHISDLLPRHWTYLNPSPVIFQPWFRESVIDLSNPEHMNSYSRLKRAYDMIYENSANVKSAANPFNDQQFYSATTADNYLTKFIYKNPRDKSTSGLRSRPEDRIIHIEKFYHPTDPFVIWNHVCRWFIAIPPMDPKDLVVTA